MKSRMTALHEATVHRRRIKVLANCIAGILPENAKVLDIGCGDGQLGLLLQLARPDLQIEGVDVLLRPHTAIPVGGFDGRHLPFPDRSVDIALFVDVLHHCEWATALMAEAARVARHSIVIKDHLAEGFLARPLLRFMDFIGNAGHGVVLPYIYWSRQQWLEVFSELRWDISTWTEDLKLYPFPANWLFGRNLHFLAQFQPERGDRVGDASFRLV